MKGNLFSSIRKTFTILLLEIFLLASIVAVSSASVHKSGSGTSAGGGDQHFKVYVLDAGTRTPMELARVVLRRGKAIIGTTVTNPAGMAQFIDIDEGWYRLSVHLVGYQDFFDSVLVDDQHTVDSVSLQVVNQNEVVVSGDREIAVTTFDLKSGDQVFESETYHAPPTARMTALVQENLLGAARAPTGEIHIRGMHGEFTYYVDGIPVPLGVFGGLNEVVDPKVIDRAVFMTGGYPAEYGGQMAAVIDVQNRVPTGQFHLDASTYGGSYLVSGGGDSVGDRVGSLRSLNSNGQSLSLSSHLDKLGIFLSGSRQETDRRIDPPVEKLFHDHGFDYFLYGKIDYEISDVDYLTLNLNYGKTNTEVPYDSAEGIADDIQNTTNSFQTLSYYRVLSSEKNKESNLFIGAYAREGGLIYTPGLADPPGFQFVGDTINYLLAEDRSFTTLGTRVKYDASLAHEFQYAVGFNFSATSGTENFTSKDSTGAAGPSILNDFKGSDFGTFAEAQIHPQEWTKIEVGLRYDQHIAPDAPLQDQWSPRIRWNIFFDQLNSGYLYYGKLFQPNNIEGLRTIAANVSTAKVPTLPEREDFYEAAYLRSFSFGLRSKLAGFYKYATPGVDDQTIGSSAIKTPVNIEQVKITGIELGFSYNDPSTPFSGYLNTSIIHAYGIGTVSGGFLDIATDGDATDLDHDQRLSMVGSINYQPKDFFANLTGIYGSGLSNGNPNGVAYQTGLFDFNTAQHTTPSWIFNVSAGYTFHLEGTTTLEPSLYVGNILDHDHLIKGAYFSAASYEERRNVVFKLAYHL
jgi:hypothetical protein